MSYESLEKQFERKINEMPQEELESFGKWFLSIKGDLLTFYDIYKCIKSDEQRDMFLAYLYMYAIVNDKEEFDERYDQPLFSMAAKYAGIDTSECM